jgi:predicted nucleotidyltransferase
MNIHITDTELFNKLLDSTIFSTEIGSRMYGTANEKSDTDILHIYKTSDKELYSILNSHHQLQYKKDNVDYIFVSLHSFLRNCLSGDSTINFEVINNDYIVGSSLSFLYDLRKEFYNYKIMRSYLGFGRRDLKHISKATGDYAKNKKLFHAYRCYKSCKDILSNDFISVMGDAESFEYRELVYAITDYKERDKYKKDLEGKIEELRKELNIKYDSGELINYMNVDIINIIDSRVKSLMEDDDVEKLVLTDDEMKLFYDAEENGINY